MPGAATLEMLERLVGHDSVSRNSNLPLIADVEAFLDRQGVSWRRFMSPCGTKANLLATVGPVERPGMILSGHVDVVPVDGQSWTGDPFRLTEREGRYYGRGTTDMKGFDALVLAKIPDMLAAGLHHPVHIALSYDEEVGCTGVQAMLHELREERFTALGCIVGEPTSMQTIIAHKTKRAGMARFFGFECHSSLAPQGVNAVEYAARLTTFISDMGREYAASGPRDELYDIPFGTAHVGVLRGGTALNIVPGDADMVYELRLIGEQDIETEHARIETFVRDELEPAMKAVRPECGIRLIETSTIAGVDTEADAPLSRLSRELCGRDEVAKVAFGTEAGLFQQFLGIPAVVCGPGDIGQAHKPDEYIEAGQLEAGERYLDGLIERLKSPW